MVREGIEMVRPFVKSTAEIIPEARKKNNRNSGHKETRCDQKDIEHLT